MKNEIVVFGKPFQVVIENLDVENCNGQTDLDGRSIHINEGMSEAMAHEVILHEMLHVILELSGLSNILSEGEEEAIVRAISYGLEGHVKLSGQASYILKHYLSITKLAPSKEESVSTPREGASLTAKKPRKVKS